MHVLQHNYKMHLTRRQGTKPYRPLQSHHVLLDKMACPNVKTRLQPIVSLLPLVT
jgi:hypothetical protein